MARSERNPRSVEQYGRSDLGDYMIYVGTIITPKIKTPVSVFVSGHEDRFIVFVPDRRLVVGAGYFGEHEGPLHCTRQHMQPGLIDRNDQGTGLGTSLYVAGNMVVAAAQDAGRKFPWRMTSDRCTYSFEADRIGSADRAWANMRKHKLASRKGTVTAEVEGEWITSKLDVMQWDTVKRSGLVLHLSDYFADPYDFKHVPPEVFGSLDWSNTPDEMFGAFAEANEDGGIGTAQEWIRAAACTLVANGDEERAGLLLDAIGESVPTREAAANPDVCPTVFRAESRSWERQWGEDFTEPERMDEGIATEPTKRRLNRGRARRRNPDETVQQLAARLARGGW